MTRTLFTSIWKSLAASFPTKAADDAKLFLMYYEEAKGIPDGSANKLLSLLLKDSEYFPKLGRFADICASLAPRKADCGSVKNATSCRYCLNTGLIFDDLHGDRTLAFACPKCEKGKSMKKPYIRFYNQRYGDDGLEELRRYNDEKREEMGDPREYFFKVMNKWGEKLKNGEVFSS